MHIENVGLALQANLKRRYCISLRLLIDSKSDKTPRKPSLATSEIPEITQTRQYHCVLRPQFVAECEGREYFDVSCCLESPFLILLCGVHKQIWADLNIFNTASLTSDEDIAIAVAVLEGTLDGYSAGPIIHRSLQPEHPYAFEFMISSVNNTTFAYILSFVLNKFPSNPSEFRSSLGYETVFRLSRSLSQLSYDFNGRPEYLDDHCRRTEMAPTVLEDLSTLLQSSFFEEAESSNRKTTQQSKAQQSKTPRRRKALTGAHAEIEDKLFQALGSRVPRTRESAEKILTEVVKNQKDTLRFFFTLLRRPEITRLIRSAYFRGNIPQGVRVDAAMLLASGTTYSSSASGGDLIQADLYFPSAAGFGEWRILCSPSFLSDMTRDRALSKAMMGRLRARLPGGTRLVVSAVRALLVPEILTLYKYFVDVISEFGRNPLLRLSRTRASFEDSWNLQYGQAEANRLGQTQQISSDERCKARKPRGGFYYDPVIFNVTRATKQIATISTDFSRQDQEVDEIRRLFEMSFMTSSRVVNTPAFFIRRRSSLAEKKVIEFTKSSFVIGRSGTGLLADKVEHDYTNLLFSLSAGPEMPQYVRERIQRWNSRRRNKILDLDDAEGTRDDLPEKFSELQESHFPLFITVDTLWSLLEADVRPPPSKSQHSRTQKRDSDNKWLRHTDLVTFDVFKRKYWHHLPQFLTKGIVPSVAFGDIIGTIKGETYESLTNRDYALFESYQKIKRERRHTTCWTGINNWAERQSGRFCVGGVHSFSRIGELSGPPLEVTWTKCKTYSSSTLDHDVVIISLCRNPDGFLWAGDTAQTISIGSTFSFRELGAFVYRYQGSIQALRGTPSRPEGFQLLVNYRSRGDIVKCANAIIQLLRRFPGAIDVLQLEEGIAGKAMPMFFHSECLPSQEHDFFLSSTGQPCIIVRDEAARQKLRRDTGRVGIVLTLFNSKGLEYDDVILYNFFGESANANLWRHLTDGQSHSLEDPKHAPLIYELKCLYVAITRARHKLWIVDYSDVCLPIKRYLLNLGLVEEPPTARNSLKDFVNRSSSKGWSEAGNRLLDHGEFEEAAMAFENAGDVYMQAVAVAFHLREVARDIPESATKRRREAFVAAADAFEHCAAMAGNEEEEHSRYVAAARCYAEIKYHQEVVRNLKRAGMYTEAASYCFDNNLLKDAVSLIKTSRVDQETTERVKQVARISYLEAKNLEEAEKLFDDEEEKMEFVVEHELGEARAIILVKQEKYGEAVRQYLDEGQELEALELALEHIHDITQDVNALNAIVTKILWRYLSFGCRGWPENMTISASKIHKLLETVPLWKLPIKAQQTFYLFERIFLGGMSTTSRKTLASYILRCDPLDRASKLLALDLYFDDMSSALDVSSQSGIVSSLHLFHEYSLLMRDGALDKAPWDSPWLCTLLQIEGDGEDVRMKPGTFLYEGCMRGDSSQPEEQSEVQHSAVSDLLTRENSLYVGPVVWNIQPPTALTKAGLTEEFDSIYSRRLLGALENALNPLSYLNGSISSLNRDLIPEAADGFVTVQRWAFDVLYKLNPSRDELQGAFLTNLYKAFTLARLRQDGRVDNCLFRIPSARKQQHPRLVVHYPFRRQIYTLRDFLAFMDGSGDLAQGIRFFGYMVQIRLPVDPAVLCTVVERLFGLAIMAQRYRELGSLHGVLLPRTWILALWEDFFRFKDRRLAPLWQLAQATERLLKDIYTGEYQRHAIMDPRRATPSDVLQRWRISRIRRPSFSKDIPPKYVQDLCVARICFCLLGENFGIVRNNVVRDSAFASNGSFSGVNSVSLASSSSEKKPARYINSRHWTDLAATLYQSYNLTFRPPFTFRDINSIPNVLQPRSGDLPTTTIESYENAGGSYAATAGRVAATDGIDGIGDEHVDGAAEYSGDDAIDVGDGEGPDKSKEAGIIQKAARQVFAKMRRANFRRQAEGWTGSSFQSLQGIRERRSRRVPKGSTLGQYLIFFSAWNGSSRALERQKYHSDILKEARELRRQLEPGASYSLHPQVDTQSRWDAARDLGPLRNAGDENEGLVQTPL
ncbi:hypothetical protein EDB83DRAFT_2312005 [Lactarius deliciosus]|nr:hypothetical protein EDB83DRAFT_2312005 [Lactarius deliciosus]